MTLREFTERWVAERARREPTVDTIRDALAALAEQAKVKE